MAKCKLVEAYNKDFSDSGMSDWIYDESKWPDNGEQVMVLTSKGNEFKAHFFGAEFQLDKGFEESDTDPIIGWMTMSDYAKYDPMSHA